MSDSFIPDQNSKHKSENLIPRYFRTIDNRKFLSSTVDQLIQEGAVEKINSYIGKRDAKGRQASDSYVTDIIEEKNNYQLDPAVVIKDNNGNVDFFADYQDYIHQLEFLANNNLNHDKVNTQEFYSLTAHIDWDKVTNYPNYYWLPHGPEPIFIEGQFQNIVSSYKVTLKYDDESVSYVFSNDTNIKNPTITLYKGQVYVFEIDTPGHPLAIKTIRDDGELGQYNEGVSEQFVESGTIIFTVSNIAPDVLFYVSKNDANTSGQFKLKHIVESSYLNVETDIIGKKTYITKSGLELSNGMRVYFRGQIYPEIYNKSYWYVEGVGDSIQLINEKDLDIPALYSQDAIAEFDDKGFDEQAFEVNTNFPEKKDYITYYICSMHSCPMQNV